MALLDTAGTVVILAKNHCVGVRTWLVADSMRVGPRRGPRSSPRRAAPRQSATGAGGSGRGASSNASCSVKWCRIWLWWSLSN